eukprot:CAMPEP_0179483178 /NCGR_PEP_ID=MMETSP0799-20121207/60461_1 /TAXON_ID=46947 /ORGANISM="Geminigera cryophila, Strain CCMP2564" /LENGTH=71 /DNA_ID=CAMNT_0021296635 /DNA_START=288 /DNA_END=503 /DNA_ORIENTATION=-
MSSFKDHWDMESAYVPYTPAPMGFDASRFPDRSGEGPVFQYGASMFSPAPSGADGSRFPDRSGEGVNFQYA